MTKFATDNICEIFYFYYLIMFTNFTYPRHAAVLEGHVRVQAFGDGLGDAGELVGAQFFHALAGQLQALVDMGALGIEVIGDALLLRKGRELNKQAKKFI